MLKRKSIIRKRIASVGYREGGKTVNHIANAANEHKKITRLGTTERERWSTGNCAKG